MKKLVLFLLESMESVATVFFMVIIVSFLIIMSTLDELKSSVYYTDKVRKRVVRRASHSIRKSMRERWVP